jgi:hypothetical protein
LRYLPVTSVIAIDKLFVGGKKHFVSHLSTDETTIQRREQPSQPIPWIIAPKDPRCLQFVL